MRLLCERLLLERRFHELLWLSWEKSTQQPLVGSAHHVSYQGHRSQKTVECLHTGVKLKYNSSDIPSSCESGVLQLLASTIVNKQQFLLMLVAQFQQYKNVLQCRSIVFIISFKYIFHYLQRNYFKREHMSEVVRQ